MRLYNTMSRSYEVFRPRTSGIVKVFTCGPSIYRRPHIGNYRTFLYEDLLMRYLEYKGYRVEHAMPLTDIEDKTIIEAKKQNRKIEELTADIESIFIQEARRLNIRLPRKLQRVSRCVDTAAEIILVLMEKGYAYRHGKDIFFDTLKDKDFGRLYRVDLRQWPKKHIRFRRDTYTGNRWNKGDFILWHGYREGDPTWWETPIGKGRPSWNIQDPSVIIRHLGDQVDINCGGIDNIYRHHDYNIAIMESYTGVEYARYFLHGEHLIVEGKPMSKSRGNIIYPEDITSRGCDAKDVRFFLLYTHYRTKLNYTDKNFRAACRRANELRSIISGLKGKAKSRISGNSRVQSIIKKMRKDFETQMDDDLSFGKAFDAIESAVRHLDSMKEDISRDDARALDDTLRKIDSFMGIIF